MLFDTFQGVELQCLFERCHTVGVVEIHCEKWRHDGLSAVICLLDTLFGGKRFPHLGNYVQGRLWQDAIVPSNYLFACLSEVTNKKLQHVVLQLGKVVELEFRHLFHTLGAVAPTVFGGFVSAKVDVLTWEHVANFVQDVANKLVTFLVAGTQNVLGDAPIFAHFGNLACATELGVGCKYCNHVAGDIQLGDDFDMPLTCVGNNFRNVRFG